LCGTDTLFVIAASSSPLKVCVSAQSNGIKTSIKSTPRDNIKLQHLARSLALFVSCVFYAFGSFQPSRSVISARVINTDLSETLLPGLLALVRPCLAHVQTGMLKNPVKNPVKNLSTTFNTFKKRCTHRPPDVGPCTISRDRPAEWHCFEWLHQKQSETPRGPFSACLLFLFRGCDRCSAIGYQCVMHFGGVLVDGRALVLRLCSTGSAQTQGCAHPVLRVATCQAQHQAFVISRCCSYRQGLAVRALLRALRFRSLSCGDCGCRLHVVRHTSCFTMTRFDAVQYTLIHSTTRAAAPSRRSPLLQCVHVQATIHSDASGDLTLGQLAHGVFHTDIQLQC
jgi:hypothetical protein